MKNYQKDHINVRVYDSRQEMGQAAADDIASRITALLASQDAVRMIFASAPSQNEFLATLAARQDVDFSRVTAFHLDEYVGLPADAPQGFGNFLKDRLFSKVRFGAVHYMDGLAADSEAECERYAALLLAAPIDIAILGIGENAHIAFNDPPVADFNDPKTMKVVELDGICRQQQVNDGCFASLADVPTHALTLSCPALMAADAIICIAPGPTKTNAIYNTLESKISTEVPSSILRTKPGVVLYVDTDSARRLGEVSGLTEL